jgi:Tfp pilus assembly protein FimT
MSQTMPDARNWNARIISGSNARDCGFSVIELLIVLLVGMVMTAMAIPASKSAIASYQLDAAIDTLTGSIQSTRYQAIMHDYPYQVDINSTTSAIQVSSEPGGSASFSPVGSAVPISGSPVTINAGTTSNGPATHVTLTLKPNGSITVTSGQTTPVSFTITYYGTTKTITVSNYGSIHVQ